MWHFASKVSIPHTASSTKPHEQARQAAALVQHPDTIPSPLLPASVLRPPAEQSSSEPELCLPRKPQFTLAGHLSTANMRKERSTVSLPLTGEGPRVSSHLKRRPSLQPRRIIPDCHSEESSVPALLIQPSQG